MRLQQINITSNEKRIYKVQQYRYQRHETTIRKRTKKTEIERRKRFHYIGLRPSTCHEHLKKTPEDSTIPQDKNIQSVCTARFNSNKRKSCLVQDKLDRQHSGQWKGERTPKVSH